MRIKALFPLCIVSALLFQLTACNKAGSTLENAASLPNKELVSAGAEQDEPQGPLVLHTVELPYGIAFNFFQDMDSLALSGSAVQPHASQDLYIENDVLYWLEYSDGVNTIHAKNLSTDEDSILVSSDVYFFQSFYVVNERTILVHMREDMLTSSDSQTAIYDVTSGTYTYLKDLYGVPVHNFIYCDGMLATYHCDYFAPPENHFTTISVIDLEEERLLFSIQEPGTDTINSIWLDGETLYYWGRGEDLDTGRLYLWNTAYTEAAAILDVKGSDDYRTDTEWGLGTTYFVRENQLTLALGMATVQVDLQNHTADVPHVKEDLHDYWMRQWDGGYWIGVGAFGNVSAYPVQVYDAGGNLQREFPAPTIEFDYSFLSFDIYENTMYYAMDGWWDGQLERRLFSMQAI